VNKSAYHEAVLGKHKSLANSELRNVIVLLVDVRCGPNHVEVPDVYAVVSDFAVDTQFIRVARGHSPRQQLHKQALPRTRRPQQQRRPPLEAERRGAEGTGGARAAVPHQRTVSQSGNSVTAEGL
jgi:hypothetical protein